jgi:hypothetical protein
MVSFDQLPRANAAGPAAANREVREFDVLLKGKPTGTTKFTIDQLPDGRTVVTTDAAVKVNMVVFVYNYEFHGVETWAGDFLQSFQCQGSDGGKKFAVSGSVGPAGCQLTVNQKNIQGPQFAMTGNYWRLPALAPRDRPLPIVDPSTGALQNVRIADASAARIPLGDQEIPASGFRLTGDVDVTLWLDAQGRIVRQQSVEQGYPTELRLTRISREPTTAPGSQLAPPVYTANGAQPAGPAGGIRK